MSVRFAPFLFLINSIIAKDFVRYNPHFSISSLPFRIPLEQVRVPLKHYKSVQKVASDDGLEHNILFHEVPLENQYDLIYVGRVRIGDSRKSFRALFDSGSSDIWFISKDCRSEFCAGRPAYKVEETTSLSDYTRIRYASGSISGYLASNDVQAADLTSRGQYFVAANSVDISRHFKFDGIIGMSPRRSGIKTRRPTFVTSLHEQHLIRRSIFSFVLYEFDDKDNESYMILGGVDRSLYKGDLNWISNTDSLFWTLQITHVGFGSTFGRTEGRAIIDSGTSYILCPKHLLNGIHDLIGARLQDSYYVVPCNQVRGMPTITLMIHDDLEIPLYPEDYIYKLDGVCYSSFLPMDREMEVRDHKKPDWILGASFLRAYYVAFDIEKSRIGLARISPFLGNNRRPNLPLNVTMKEDIRLEGIETAYLMEMAIGSPPRYFLVIIDTGSCDFWITEESCSGFACQFKERYHMPSSLTGRGPFEPFKIGYLDSYLKGKIYQDHVYLSRVEAQDLHFGGAMEMNGLSLVGHNFDGILGLCPIGSRWGKESILENLYRNNAIDQLVFSIWLSPELKEPGRLTIGRIAEELTDSDVHWFEAGRRNKWATTLSSFKFGIEEQVSKRSGIAFDSGCTNILLPSRVAKSIHSKLGAWFSHEAQAYEVRCEDVWKFPRITIVIGPLKLTLSPDQYIVVQNHGCFSTLDERDVIKYGTEIWIMGCPFMRAYFTAYDLENRRFGVALPARQKKNAIPPRCEIE